MWKLAKVALFGLLASVCTNVATPVEVVTRAASETAEAKTARMAFSIELPDDGLGLALNGDGSYDFANRRGAFGLTFPPVDGESMGRVEYVAEGQVLYAKFPSAMGAFLGGRPWVRIDVAQLSQESGVGLDELGQTTPSDPGGMVDYLRGASDDTTKVGTEKLRGTEVTHYRATIDLERAAAGAPPGQRDSLNKAREMLGTSRFPAEVWVDGQGRLRKISYTIDFSRLTPKEDFPGEGSASFTFEFFDFGTPVRVQAPPPEEVTDFAELLQRSRQRFDEDGPRQPDRFEGRRDEPAGAAEPYPPGYGAD